ncbi:ATPase, T2SS/T4P/T4SS family [Alicyclobacillus acidoterrestris]|uniref:Flp pilus assembly complex ATPase component TadA n=1 Tax=Alicyclobacillus acidoterrestris (strain ATCC 49025 / DSM 3922 / CIP 106132 / NCIMB 13137 / GD3B) TaxID=1356854 RepID=T0BUZ8_ALIAG|nr:ATPase, T2SS/T4P/T4SS family [Alicyclobacillus acidoterrestris]EPZ47903.1 hypothetical protein N007_04910 [Alicyclobacillus acidoterrestris ATCC 49025]UNO51031.1 Flp pilus assembly complex ATPase component TadA [Alicyclobacillus acidoterrestris]GEO27766.1 hypothetical protein AAC03nite_35510 [Alicyclobacillus acidoterrestris]
MAIENPEEVLAQIQRNSSRSLQRVVDESRNIRQNYQERKIGDGNLMEQQVKILLDFIYNKDIDFLRQAPTEAETKARLAKAIQQGDVERLAVNVRDAIEQVAIHMYHHGILQPLMDASRPDVTDIWVFGKYGIMYREYGQNHWFVNQSGERIHFESHDELRRYIERKLGTEYRLDLSAASTNAIFPDGSRLIYRDKACGFSTWINGEYVLFQNEPILCIRRFGRAFSLEELMMTGMFTARMRLYFEFLARIRESFLIGGPTGSGKSTLQNAIMEYLPQNELTAMLEDTPDAKIRGGFFLRLYTQEANGEDKGEITIGRNLFDVKRLNSQNTLVGEMRDGFTAMRASDVAMMTSGLFSTTMHAETIRKMIKAYINMLKSSPDRPSEAYAFDLFATCFQQLISVELVHNKPLVTEIGEVLGANDNGVDWRPVFERKYSSNKVIFHGLSERMIERAYKYDVVIPEELLSPGEESIE